MALALGLTALCVALACPYPDLLSLPFGNDDYLMLERTARSSPLAWWGRGELFVGWWRPWSRETHVGWLQHVFGAREAVFHAANLLLACAAVVAFALLARRLAGARAGALAACGAAAMAAWGYPLLVASGAQELWLLLASVLALAAWSAGRGALALAAFALALASKETAALLPLVFAAHDRLVAGRGWRETARRAVAPLVLSAAWVAWHPHLGGGGFAHVGGAESATGLAPSPARVLLRTALAPLGLDVPLAPAAGWAAVLPWALVSAACLAVAQHALGRDGTAPSRVPGARMAAFGAAWALAGWAPLLLPGLGWHAYYTLFGGLGLWLALSPALARLPAAAATALLAALAFTAAARTATFTHDWADVAFLRRAAGLVAPMRASLLRELPDVPPGSRLYFTAIPTEIGFLTGEGPMFRALYGEPTTRAAFLADWRPRAAGEPAGPDFFLHGEPGPRVRLMREAGHAGGLGPEALATWAADQRLLARTFARAGDYERALGAFARLARDPAGVAADAVAAAECERILGRADRAREYDAIAARRMAAELEAGKARPAR